MCSARQVCEHCPAGTISDCLCPSRDVPPPCRKPADVDLLVPPVNARRARPTLFGLGIYAAKVSVSKTIALARGGGGDGS